MVIIEGPDGSGKTTLLHKLSADLGLLIQPRAANSDAEYTTRLDDWVIEHNSKPPGRIIYDRHQLISHLMYGPLMKRTMFGAFTNVTWLSDELDKLWSKRPIIVLCLPSLFQIKDNLDRDEHKVAEADIDVFYWNYHNWLAQYYHHAHVIHYDYTTDDYEPLKSHIDRLLTEKGL